ncbi:T9SS type A sorting domain-containing protein [bacterium]|nr:T9SS type A sorting domain-containing protein [bacterium]
MKRLVIRIIFIFVIGIIFGIYESVHSQIITMSIQNSPVTRGATVEIPVNIQGISVSDSVLCYQMTFWYDSDVVQCVGATSVGTMTQQWGDPYVGPKTDTVRVGGFTTNQPTKRLVQDAGQLVKLQFLVIGNPGSSTLVRFINAKLFNINGEMNITNKINGTLTVVTNPNTTNIDLILYPDWNRISLPIVPTNNTFPEVFNGLPVGYVRAFYYGENYKTWVRGRPSYANDLYWMDGIHGYEMRLDSTVAVTLQTSGELVSLNTPIILYKGWNLISYLPSVSDEITHALEFIDLLYLYVIEYREYDLEHPVRTWGRDRPPYANDLSELTPLIGYWVEMDTSSTLIYPESPLPKFLLKSSFYQNVEHHFITDQTPRSCDFWADQPDILFEGDSICVYDVDGILCGKTAVFQEGGFLVHVFGDDLSTLDIDEGPLSGEEVRFTVNGDSATVVGASPDSKSPLVMGEKAIWEDKESKHVQLEINQSYTNDHSNLDVPINMVDMKNYPNPFNSQTVISYQIPAKGNVSIHIFDATGRIVRTLVQNRFHEPGQYDVRWDGYDEQGEPVSSGVYIYQLQTGDIRLNKKMILLY